MPGEKKMGKEEAATLLNLEGSEITDDDLEILDAAVVESGEAVSRTKEEGKPSKKDDEGWKPPEDTQPEVLELLKDIEPEKQERYYQDLKLLEMDRTAQEEKKKKEVPANEQRLRDIQSHYDRKFEEQERRHEEAMAALRKTIEESKPKVDPKAEEEEEYRKILAEVEEGLSEDEKKDLAEDTLLQKSLRIQARRAVAARKPVEDPSKDSQRAEKMGDTELRLAYLEHDKIVSRKHPDWESIVYQDGTIRSGRVTPAWGEFLKTLTPQEVAELNTGGPQAAIKYLDKYKGVKDEEAKALAKADEERITKLRQEVFGTPMGGEAGSTKVDKKSREEEGVKSKGKAEDEFLKGIDEEEKYQDSLKKTATG